MRPQTSDDPNQFAPASVRAALRDAIASLEGAQVPSAALAAELLLMHTLGCERTHLYAHPEEVLDAAQSERYARLLARRAAGVPTQYLTGRQEFWGLEFEVTPDVLVPRPETEHVIEVALARLGAASQADGASPAAAARKLAPWRIADIGTGSGCIALALAHELPQARIVATDISEAAVEIAQRNAARHGVASRIEFVHCNLLDFRLGSRATGHGLRSFDLIASNPPYIATPQAATLQREVREHEPASALFGGITGAEIYPPLIAQAEERLKPGGILVLEIDCSLAEQLRALLPSPPWEDFAVANDLAGLQRVVSARRSCG